MVKDIQSLVASDIMSVYTGASRAGCCCCGCKGKHRYNSVHLELANKDRGYKITGDEVDDRTVLKTLRLVQSEHAGDPKAVTDAGNCVAVEIGKRIHILYFVPGVTVTA